MKAYKPEPSSDAELVDWLVIKPEPRLTDQDTLAWGFGLYRTKELADSVASRLGALVLPIPRSRT